MKQYRLTIVTIVLLLPISARAQQMAPEMDWAKRRRFPTVEYLPGNATLPLALSSAFVVH